MAEVKTVPPVPITASPRPCAFVSPDEGNAPTITPVRNNTATLTNTECVSE